MSDEKPITIPCRICGRPMIERVNRVTLSTFLGCSGYPEFCNETAKLPEYIRLKAAGAAELPGFGEEE